MIYIFLHNTPKAAVLASILCFESNHATHLFCVNSIKEAQVFIEKHKPSYKDEIWFFGFPKDTTALNAIKKYRADIQLIPKDYSILFFWTKIFGNFFIPAPINLLEQYFTQELDEQDRSYFELFFVEEIFTISIHEPTFTKAQSLAFMDSLISLYSKSDSDHFKHLWTLFLENQHNDKNITTHFLDTSSYKNAIIKSAAILQSQTGKAMNYRTLYCASPGMGELGIIHKFLETKDVDCVVLYHFNGNKWVFIVAERGKQTLVDLSKYKTKDYCDYRQFELSQTIAKPIIAAISRKD